MTHDYDPTELAIAVRALSAVCDGAIADDTRGWNGSDTTMGHALAALDPRTWPLQHTADIYRRLAKYRRQLLGMGIRYEDIPVPPALKGERTMACTPGDAGCFDLSVPYSDGCLWPLKQAVGLPQVQFDRVRRIWMVRPRRGAGTRLLAWAQEYGVALAPGVAERVHAIDADQTQQSERHVDLVGNTFVLTFPRDQVVIDATKALPRRQWNRDLRRWEVPASQENAHPFAALVTDYAFTLSASARTRLDEILVAPAEPPKPARRLEVDGQGGVRFISPWDPALTEAFKEALPSTERSWVKEQRFWHVAATPTALAHVLAFAARHDVHVPPSVHHLVQESAQRHEERIAASRAESADLHIDGFGNGLRPYPFQLAAIKYAASTKTCFLADEMGLGKTVEALGTIQLTQSYPALIVCPASVKYNWRKETSRWLLGKTVAVLEGTKPSGIPQADILIANYDILHGWSNVLTKLGLKAMVLDESHYIKSKDARRSQAALHIGKSVPLKLCVSGTPILNRPAELVTQLEFLGRIKDFGGSWAFLKRYTNMEYNGYGYNYSGATNLQELNDRLRGSCFIRRLKKDCLRELPPKTRADVPLPIDNRAEYRKAEADVAAWFAAEAVSDEEFLASIADLEPRARALAIHQRAISAEQTARRAEQLVRFEALKTMAMRGKMKAALEWIEDFLATEEKLVVFCHHREAQREVLAALHAYQPARIFAEDGPALRQANVECFQNEASCRVIVCSLGAGGVGITLTAASNVCLLELGWNGAQMSQAEDRCHRVGTTNPVTAWYLLADKTIDQELVEMIHAKQVVVDQATEGSVEDGEDSSIIADLAKKLADRAQGR